jgi:hypothetical protein
MKIDLEINIKGLRDFGFLTGGLTVILFGLLLPWLFSYSIPTWPWIISFLLIGCALVRPLWLRPIYKAWMKIGHILGWVNTRIILGVMYYLIILPIGMIMHLVGYDPMERKKNQSLKSYRKISNKYLKKDLERMF